jgi:dynein heavy chain, axonemal
LLEVRHSVFVVGNAGTGKTQVWKTLFRTYQNIKKKPIYNDLNPKAVTNDELFGIINPATRWFTINLKFIYEHTNAHF